MYRSIYLSLYMRVCVCVLQGHGEADRRLSPGVGGRGRSPLIICYMIYDYNMITCKYMYEICINDTYSYILSDALID